MPPPDAPPYVVPTMDPRVASDFNPPGDLFRAQMVCELLMVCGQFFVSGTQREKLGVFLTYFQYYLLCKPVIPLAIEFNILDTLDSLEDMARAEIAKKDKKSKRKPNKRSKKAAALVAVDVVFPRYNSLATVSKRVEELEAAKLEARRVSYNAGAAPVDDDEAEHEVDAEEADDDHSDSGDDNDGDGTDSDESSSDDDDDDDETEEQVHAREAAKMMKKMRIAEEDEEFDKAFRAVMQVMTHFCAHASVIHCNLLWILQESVESASAAARTAALVDRMAIPAVIPKPKNVVQLDGEDQSDEDEEDEVAGQSRRVAFKLLSRDHRGRVESRQLLVAEDNPMAVRLAKAEMAQRLEKQRNATIGAATPNFTSSPKYRTFLTLLSRYILVFALNMP